MPVVSVIIPTYNRPDLLQRSVQSVLEQTFQDFEIVIIDNGEKRSREVIASINDNRIKYVEISAGMGGSVARNKGITSSNSHLLAFLDDDDIWEPEKLEQQVKILSDSEEKVGFCFTAVKYKYNDRIETTSVPEGVINYYETALRHFKGILTSTLVVKRSSLNKVGMFDDRFPSHQEAELIIRLSKKYEGFGVNKAYVTMNTGNVSASIGANLSKRIEGRKLLLKKYQNEFVARPHLLAKHLFGLSLWQRDLGFYDDAFMSCKKSLKSKFKVRVFIHCIMLAFSGSLYKFIRKE